jgi:hypothetical protein
MQIQGLKPNTKAFKYTKPNKIQEYEDEEKKRTIRKVEIT